MQELKPIKYQDSYEFFEWLESHPEYELEAITVNVNRKSHLVTQEMFLKFRKETQQLIIDEMLRSKNVLAYPPYSLKLFESINNLN
jgi:hypothetical protein